MSDLEELLTVQLQASRIERSAILLRLARVEAAAMLIAAVAGQLDAALDGCSLNTFTENIRAELGTAQYKLVQALGSRAVPFPLDFALNDKGEP